MLHPASLEGYACVEYGRGDKFLRRAFGGGDRTITVTITTFAGHRPYAVVDVVGGGSHPYTIAKFAGGRGVDGVRFPYQALVVPEPTNRYGRPAL